VKSATHHWSGRVGVLQALLTKSGSRGARRSDTVVVVRRSLARLTPTIPKMPIKRTTWSRPMFSPARRIAVHSLSEP
jgi:hypothetical protein